MNASNGTGIPRLLIIDDNASIHEAIRAILQGPEDSGDLTEMRDALFGRTSGGDERRQFRIDSAAQGMEGLELARRALEEEDPYSAAFVDVRMPPGWDGLETIAHIWAVDPRIEMVVCTAYSDHSWKDVVRRLGCTDRLLILKKPFDSLEVRQLAMALSTKWRLNRTAEMKVQALEEEVQRRTEERLRLLEQLHQAQKQEAIGQVAQGIVHDFKNFVGVIRGCTSRLLAEPTLGEPGRAAVETIETAAEQAHAVTQSLLAFSRAGAGERRPLDLRELVAEMERLLRYVLPAAITLDVAVPGEPLPVQVRAGQIQQVVLNLAINARDAMPAGGRLRMSLERLDTARARLRLEDNGTGMSAEVQARALEPFYTTKPRGQGTGLGLAIVQSIVEEHGGHVELITEPGKGTCVDIVLPLSCTPSGTPSTPGKAEVRELLLVESRQHLRALLGPFLRGAGFAVREAADGSAALASVEGGARPPCLCIVDLADAEEGLRLAGSLRLPGILLSDEATAVSDHPARGWEVLRKPFAMSDLGNLVNRMLSEQVHGEHA